MAKTPYFITYPGFSPGSICRFCLKVVQMCSFACPSTSRNQFGCLISAGLRPKKTALCGRRKWAAKFGPLKIDCPTKPSSFLPIGNPKPPPSSASLLLSCCPSRGILISWDFRNWVTRDSAARRPLSLHSSCPIYSTACSMLRFLVRVRCR